MRTFIKIIRTIGIIILLSAFVGGLTNINKRGIDPNDTAVKKFYYILEDEKDYMFFKIYDVSAENNYIFSDITEFYYSKAAGFSIDTINEMTYDDFFEDVNWDLVPDKDIKITENDEYITAVLTVSNVMENSMDISRSGLINTEKPLGKNDVIYLVTENPEYQELTEDEYKEKKENFRSYIKNNIEYISAQDQLSYIRYFLTDESEGEYKEFTAIGLSKAHNYLSSYSIISCFNKSAGYTAEAFSDVSLEELMNTVKWELIPDKKLEITENDDYVILTAEVNNLFNNEKSAFDSGLIILKNPLKTGQHIDGNSLCDLLKTQEISESEFLNITSPSSKEQ